MQTRRSTHKNVYANTHTWQTTYTDLVILWHHCQCYMHVNRLLWLAEPGCLTEATKTMGISVDTFHIPRQLARDDCVKAAASESDPPLPFSDTAVWWRSEPSWLIGAQWFTDWRAPWSSQAASHNDPWQTKVQLYGKFLHTSGRGKRSRGHECTFQKTNFY